MQAITEYLSREGYSVIDSSYYNQIALWLKWYKGKTPFHAYTQYNGRKKIRRERKTLGMAKKVAEDWANLLLNEKVEIVIGDENCQKAVKDVLDRNNFRVRGNQLVELAFALGTGAIVEYLNDGEVEMDYIRAGMIYPLRWENGEIIDCAFASERVDGKRKLVYLNIHERDNRGLYVIRNLMFERRGNHLTPTDLPEGVLEEVSTGSAVPCFQVIRPNIVNNVDLDCPMGVSVYANAMDQMEGLDLAYDSYCNEFRLGKKRIIVPTTMARMMMDEVGSTRPMFDDNDTEFYAVSMGDGADQKIQEINMELRYEAHEAAIKTGLNLVAEKCGLGNDRYKFEQGQVKTATEVISEKSDLFQNLRKHELVLEKVLVEMTKAIAVLLQQKTDFEVTVNFDDSIIEDKTAERQRDVQEVRDGLMQKWEFRVKWYGETEQTAKKMVGNRLSDDEWMGFREGGEPNGV